MIKKVSMIMLCLFTLLCMCGCSDKSNYAENIEKCISKGMEYDTSTGECITVYEARDNCLRDPNCTWAK